ncbi:uncharacterized protein K02A2.6-like [Amyelois transitella]|uniref:uncharacterized protein K02A2.6-like n=1 Tax=Amyelois transitella TaxID=680683 RepID=UPI0029903F9B|nr:uncharacterized protein K02A2.6-like [Amyelois transitella]
MSVGKVREFDVKNGNWCAYVDRLEMYFVANKITDELKLPTFIALIGEQAYELLSTLASPKKPSTLTYKEAVETLRAHLQPKPSILAERFRFRQRQQLTTETVAEYVAELKKMSRYCEFGATLEENLRDQFVCGLRSEISRQRLFAEGNLDYTKAVALACTLEAAERDAGAVEKKREQESAENIHKIEEKNCTVCGGTQHRAVECRYKEFECNYCKKKGHLQRMCGKKASIQRGHYSFGGRKSLRGRANGPGVHSGWRSRGAGASAGGREGRAAHTHWLAERPERAKPGDSEHEDSADDYEPMYQMSLNKYSPVGMRILVNKKELNMEVDTGSALSCISVSTYRQMFNELILKPCRLRLRFYDGSVIRPLGYVEVVVDYRGTKKLLDLYIIDNGTTSLLGRQWISELNIEIPKITVHHVQEKEVCKVKLLNDIIYRHKNLFDGTLGKYTGREVDLHVRDGTEPVFHRARPVPYALRPRIDAELDSMLSAGVIEPVERSDWATPLVIVRKADGGIRLCADFKVTLNKSLLVDRYPVPKVDDLFSDLSGNNYFTKLDLSQAYNQLVLSEASREYTVINTHRGLFKYNRLVYGLASSPGIFQKFMTDLFKNVPGVLIFYDDILIKNNSLDSHLNSVEQVFNILEKNGLKIKKEKCEFMVEQVKYLGFIINKYGVHVDSEKIKPILSMPYPTNVSELKSFLGMVNFYGKFIKNLSSVTPLYDLLKKGKHWKWTSSHSKVFQQIKQLLCSTEVLTHFDAALDSIVTCDASAGGLGAILAQRGRDGRERAVAYASRALTQPERHYSQIQKEALAIIFAVDKFHQYLYGRQFRLRTDHKPLVAIFGPNTGIPNTAASRLQRWAIKLSAYEFEIEYVRTDKNTADVLSRLISKHKEGVISEETKAPEQTYLHFAVDSLLLDYNVIKRESVLDPLVSRVMRYVNEGWPLEEEIRELKPYCNRKNELYTELGCLMWGQRVVIPNSCRKKVLTELHEGHMGIVKTKSLARSYVWWPGIDEALETACRAFAVCAAVADAPPAHPSRAWPWPEQPWARLHLDFLGPIEGLTYLIIIDAHSKWIEAIKMTCTSSSSVIKVLREIWARFGIPKQIVSDNGPPFFSKDFDQFLKANGIQHIFSAPYHPASNGAAENAVKVCKRTIKKALKSNDDVHAALQRFLLAYRNTEHYTTGESPAKLLLGRRVRMRLDCLKPDHSVRVTRVRQEQADAAAGGVVTRQFDVNDPVWFREYGKSKKWAPGTISRNLGNTDYQIRSANGTEVHRHVDQLRKRVLCEIGTTAMDRSLRLTDVRSEQPRAVPRRSRPSLLFPTATEGGAASGAPAADPEVAPAPREPSEPSGSTALPDLPSVPERNDNVKRVPKPTKRYGIDEIYP